MKKKVWIPHCIYCGSRLVGAGRDDLMETICFKHGEIPEEDVEMVDAQELKDDPRI